MDNKISVIEFVDGYKKCSTQQLKNNYIKSKLVINSYVDFLKKCFICDKVIEASCDNSSECIIVNSSFRYLFFIRSMISLYTNIGIDDNDYSSWYDTLNECGALTAIMSKIPEAEVEECNTILQMKVDDFMNNNMNFRNYIASQVSGFEDMLDGLQDFLSNKLSDIK